MPGLARPSKKRMFPVQRTAASVLVHLIYLFSKEKMYIFLEREREKKVKLFREKIINEKKILVSRN